MDAKPTSPGAADDESGVDRSLIRWFLSLSPAERLASLRSTSELTQLARDARRP